MIGALTLAGEVAFRALVLAGLAARYLLRRPRLGLALLLLTPVVDLFLIAATVVDLRAGATADFLHGLAAVYVGVSVAFDHRMIRWADGWFAHRFAGGTAADLGGSEKPDVVVANSGSSTVSVLISGLRK